MLEVKGISSDPHTAKVLPPGKIFGWVFGKEVKLTNKRQTIPGYISETHRTSHAARYADLFAFNCCSLHRYLDDKMPS